MKAIVGGRRRDRSLQGIRARQAGRDGARRRPAARRPGLAIGKSAGEGVVYAKDLSRPMVFTVESALARRAEEAGRTTSGSRICSTRASFNTTRIEIVRNGQTLALREGKGQGRVEAGAPAAKAADTAKVEALLTALTSARADVVHRQERRHGAREARAERHASSTRTARSTRRSRSARKGADAFARREGDAAAAKIDATALDGIVKALDALK